MLNEIRKSYSLDRRDTMKETYELIIKKLLRDKINYDKEINEIIDKVEENELYKTYYDRLKGARNYIDELIDFFEQVLSNIK